MSEQSYWRVSLDGVGVFMGRLRGYFGGPSVRIYVKDTGFGMCKEFYEARVGAFFMTRVQSLCGIKYE